MSAAELMAAKEWCTHQLDGCLRAWRQLRWSVKITIRKSRLVWEHVLRNFWTQWLVS